MRLRVRIGKPESVTVTAAAGIGALAAAALVAGAVVLAAAPGQADASFRVAAGPAALTRAQKIVKAAEKWLTNPVTPYCWGGGDDSGPTHGDGEVAGIYTGPKGESGCYAKTVAGFDCSGLVKYAIYQALGISLDHSAQDQSEGRTDTGPDAHPKIVSTADLEPGDVVVFGSSKTSIQHDGIYIGSGDVVNAYDYKNNGDNGTDNEYWGVVKTPISWAKGAFRFEEGVRYWTGSSPGSSPSPSTAPTKAPSASPPVAPTSSPSPAAADDWAMAGHDPAQNYDNSAETAIGTANVSRLVRAWSVTARSRGGQPVVYNGEVYRLTGTVTGVGSGTDVLSVRRLSGGATVWTKSLGGNGLDTLYAAGSGEVLYGTVGNTDSLVAVSAANGAHRWSVNDTDFAAGAGEVIVDGTTIIDGGLNIQALSASTGAQRWWTAGGAGDGGPAAFAVAGGRVARTASAGGKAYLEVSNETNGDLDWKRAAPCTAADNNTNLAIGGSTIYVHDTCSGDLRAYGMSTGKLFWQAADADGQSGVGMATSGPDLYVLAQDSGHAAVLAYAAGKVSWRAAFASGTYPDSTPTLANGVLYVTVSEGDSATPKETTTAFKAATGAKLWTSPALDETLDTPFVADKHLLVGSQVYKLG